MCQSSARRLRWLEECFEAAARLTERPLTIPPLQPSPIWAARDQEMVKVTTTALARLKRCQRVLQEVGEAMHLGKVGEVGEVGEVGDVGEVSGVGRSL